MGVGPPVAKVLGSPNPRLALAIGDRRADLRGAGLGRVVIPIVEFTTHNVGTQVIEVANIAPVGVEVIQPIAPIRERQIVINPDEIDVRIGPERVEVKNLIRRARRLHPVIFGPVGGIGDFGVGQDRFDLRRKLAQLVDRWEPVCPANFGEAS